MVAVVRERGQVGGADPPSSSMVSNASRRAFAIPAARSAAFRLAILTAAAAAAAVMGPHVRVQ